MERVSRAKRRLRLSVFRSNRHIYAQIIDDAKGKTLVAFSDKNLLKKRGTETKTQAAVLVGEALAKKARAKKISEVVFDRGGYKYHGRIKALAEGARKEGLKF